MFSKNTFRGFFFLFLFLAHSTLFGAERYGAIEIGGKGVKAYVIEVDSTQATIRYRDSYNTAPQSGIDSHLVLSQEMIKQISDDVTRLKKNLIKDQNLSENALFVIASSALNKIHNKAALEASIERKARTKLFFIDEREESLYAFYGSIPKEKWQTSAMIDIGGGNTKVAWIDEKKALDFFEVPLGTVSTTQKADEIQGEKSFEEASTYAIDQALSTIPTLPTKETLYANGGIFWASAYLKTQGHLEPFVRLNKEDFERVIETFSQVSEPCNDNTSARCFLLHYYGAKNLIAGAMLAKMSIEKMHFFDQEIYFAKDGAWVIGWLLMR